MLLIRMSLVPKMPVGRRIAWDKRDARISRSAIALPRKYARGDSSDGFVMLRWTILPRPASSAALRRTRVFASASSYVTWR